MVILLTGPDLYRSHQRLNQLRQAFMHKYDQPGYNTVSLEAADVTAEEFRNAIAAGGLFTQRRFVALANFGPSSALDGAEVSTMLKPVVKDESTIVVIRETTGPQRSGGRKPRKALATATKRKAAGLNIAGAKVEEFPKLSEPQLVHWIGSEAKQRGGQVTAAAAQQLAVLCQGDTWRTSSELDKLLAFAGDRAISPTDVQTLVNSPYESNIFSVTDAIGQGRTAQAVHLVHQELAAGTHPLVLIAALAGHIRNLWLVQSVSRSHPTPAAIAQQTGLHPYVVQKSLAQSKRFQSDRLRQLHHRLVELDRTLKSTSLDAETALDQFVLMAN